MENNMSNSLIQKPIVLNENHKKIIDEWFSMLQQRLYNFNGGTYNGRKLRSELRRSSSLYAVMLQEGYMILANALFNESSALASKPIYHQALAQFTRVAAFADANNGKGTFAAQLSERIKIGERNFLSCLRFEQLLASQTPEEFCIRLIRAVKMRGEKGVNLFSLADGIFLWMQEWHDRQQNLPRNTDPFKRLSVRWAMDYNSTKKQSKE
jgi:CRISPR system Cascade subunit CasB